MARRASQPANQPERRRTKRPAYPFAAIVGQEEMKLALLLNVIDSSIGGVLMMGHRGTGKSTIVRALADLLPQIWRVSACPYGCDPEDAVNLCADCESELARDGKLPRERGRVPVVDLPLGATEDRVCGTIDIERAIKEGVRAFEPGLLARAHRGFLYIDEVNLLEDHLIDLLLDVAVTGRNSVEREGISIEHPSQFVLVGSGNPEEGELRPQLLDRFGLHVEIRTVVDVEQRVRIVELREAFDRDPAAFRASVESQQEALRRRITRARKNLRQVELPRDLLRQIAELCLQLKVDGHRGELTITRAARALAAFEGRKRVTAADVRRVATMALRHRLRRDPFEPTDSGARIEQQLAELLPESAQETASPSSDKASRNNPPSSTSNGSSHDGEAAAHDKTEKRSPHSSGQNREQRIPPIIDAGLPNNALNSPPTAPAKQTLKQHSARHQKGSAQTPLNSGRGRYVRAVTTKASGARPAIDATLRAAALNAGDRELGMRFVEKQEKRLFFSPSSNLGQPSAVAIAASDLRYKQFRRKRGALFIFAVDTSGSMAANRIGQAKGALARLLRQSYVRRDRVALVCFRQQQAELLLPPSQSVTRARRLLNSLPVGGATPLAAGLACALEVARRSAQRNAERVVLLLFTDGRSNVPLRAQAASERTRRQQLINEELEQLGEALERGGVETIVVDTQNRFTSSDEGRSLSKLVRARYAYLPLSIAFDNDITALESEIELSGKARKRVDV